MNKVSIFAEQPVLQSKKDDGFFAAVLMMAGLGLVTLYVSSAASAQRIFGNPLYFIERQLLNSIIAFAGFICFYIVNPAFLRKILPHFVIGSFLLCLLTFIPGIGEEVNKARRWVVLPIIGGFQPSEIAKFAVILFLANLFAKKHDRLDDAAVSVFPAAFGLALFVLVVFLQDDFSSAMFIMIVGLSVFFIAGVKLYWFIALCAVTVPVAFLFVFTEEYRVNRVIAFLRPSFDLHGINYQMNAARRAIASGGFWGQGFGGGMRRVSGIPEVQTDFIFAGWTEAMGFIGVVLFFVLLGYFAWRGYTIALRCPCRFCSFAAFGAVTSVVLQSLLNTGVVAGVLPSTGIPLPFFSSGGSSLIITMCMCGFVLNISRIQNVSEFVYE